MFAWRRKLKTLLALIPFLLLFRFIYHARERQRSGQVSFSPTPRSDDRQRLSHVLDRNWGDFTAIPISGYVNSAEQIDETCWSMITRTTIAVQHSRHLQDNLTQIIAAVDSHELVVDEYKSKEGMPDHEQQRTRESWTRMSGSAVWLPDQQVYLLVTRVMFYARYNVEFPFISWLRGQLFDEHWNHLDKHTITWDGASITFPMIFDIPTDYKKGGVFYGPEDPRVIIEEGVDGAEPVIMYNMLTEHLDWSRAMYSYRPFSKIGTIMTVVDQDMEHEKNWAPFFLSDGSKRGNSAREPSEYLHFVRTFDPISIIRCHLPSGICEHPYRKPLHHKVTLLRGGSNWVEIPAGIEDPNVQVWAGLHRTMVDGICGMRFYRPEFVVMVRVQSAFHLAFISTPMDFGSAVFSLEAGDDACEKGRVLTPLSIASWDMRPGRDVLTATVSVNDQTVQAVRLRGLLDIVRQLPIIELLRQGGSLGALSDPAAARSKSKDLLSCVIAAAKVHADVTRLPAHKHFWRDEIRDYNGKVIGLRDDVDTWQGVEEDPYAEGTLMYGPDLLGTARAYVSDSNLAAIAQQIL